MGKERIQKSQVNYIFWLIWKKRSYWKSLVKMASFDFQLEAFWVPLQRGSRQKWALQDHHHGWQEDLVHRVRSLGWGLLRILLFLSIWTWWKTIYSVCFRCRKSMLESRWGLLRGLCCLLTLKRRGLNHYQHDLYHNNGLYISANVCMKEINWGGAVVIYTNHLHLFRQDILILINSLKKPNKVKSLRIQGFASFVLIMVTLGWNIPHEYSTGMREFWKMSWKATFCLLELKKYFLFV